MRRQLSPVLNLQKTMAQIVPQLPARQQSEGSGPTGPETPAPSENVPVFPLRRIRDLVYFKDVGRYCFEVEWQEIDAVGNHTVTSEPLEHVMNSGRALFKFEMRQLSAFRLARQVGKKTCVGRKARIPFAAVNRKRISSEYVPTGGERVKKILYSTKHEISQGRFLEYYLVRFKGEPVYRLVRQIFLEYYFPLDLVLYWKLNHLPGPRFQNGIPGQVKPAAE
jgi:hypothetical protein